MESPSVTVPPPPRRRPIVRRPRAFHPPWRRRPLARPGVTASWTSAAGQRVCRKYRRGRFDVGRLQQREYDKLRRIVPALSALDTAKQTSPGRVSKVTTIHCLSNSRPISSSKQLRLGLIIRTRMRGNAQRDGRSYSFARWRQRPRFPVGWVETLVLFSPSHRSAPN